MSEDRSVFGRLAQRTLQTCVRGLVLAVVAVAGVPLFFAALPSLVALAAGIGILLAPRSLLAVRGLASGQRRWAREWSRVSIAAPYRPRPVELTNGLIGRLQRCKWVLTDPATWRDLLWLLVNVPAGVVLGLLPGFLVAAGVWTLVLDVGYLFFGWWPGAQPHFWAQVFLLGMLPLGVLLGPRLIKAHAQAAATLLAPTREAMAAQVGQLAESRSQAVDASAAELRRVERDVPDGAQARLVSLGMNIGFAEQVLRDNPDLALSLLAEARSSSGQALVELRTLVRGIHPPVLAERGLDGAIRALALSLPLPIAVDAELPGRPDTPVESAAFLAVAEALANVIRHSGAHSAWVTLAYANGSLFMMVGDDGHGS